MFTLAALFVAIMHEPLRAATTEIPVKGNEKILISVPEANVTLQSAPTRSLRITLSDGAHDEYTVRMQGNWIEIRPREPVTKEQFGKYVARKRMIEILGPSVPLEVHAFEGQVQLNKWAREALIHVQKGRIVSREGTGTLVAHSQSGDISVVDHQGRLDLDSFKATIQVKNLSGDAAIDNFAGETNVDRSRGTLALNQAMGSAKVTGGAGTFQFEINRGSLVTQNFQGRIDGQTAEGSVQVSVASESDVHIRSQNGKVTVQAPATSGAALNLVTGGGDITAPAYLKVARESGQKTLRARLKGEVQKGSIVVRSQDGSIVIR